MWAGVLLGLTIAVARGLVGARPLGALQGVEWEARQLPSLEGAPHTFNLFYPQLPNGVKTTPTTANIASTAATTANVPYITTANKPSSSSFNMKFATTVITQSTTQMPKYTRASTHNPQITRRRSTTKPSFIEATQSTSTTRPRKDEFSLIHLDDETNANDYVDFFPKELLEGRPYNIKIIEHEDFIDYEIEFLDMDQKEEDYQYQYYDNDDIISSTESSRITPVDPGVSSGFGLSFLDLLERAQLAHKSQSATMAPKSPPEEEPVVSTTTLLPPPVSGGKAFTSEESDRVTTDRAETSTGEVTATSATSVTASSSLLPDVWDDNRAVKPGTTGRPEEETSTAHRTTPILRQEITTVGRADEVTTLPSTTVVATTTTFLPSTFHDKEDATFLPAMYRDLPSIPESPRSGQTSPAVTTGAPATSTQLPSTDTTTETLSTLSISGVVKLEETTTEKYTETTWEPLKMADVISEPAEAVTKVEKPVALAQASFSPERRPKRIQAGHVRGQSIASEADVILSGQYHEVNPGQYKEVNPGQYHEDSPGQYQEHFQEGPGQYKEVNPGQYHETSPGQVDVENIQVDFQHSTDIRTYTLQASAGDFILGEVGRIDNTGQTVQGVRYTAVEGEVDQARISDILNRYFGARM